MRLHSEGGAAPSAAAVTVETVRSGDVRQVFAMANRGGYLESTEDIPEPHAFIARVDVAGSAHTVVFEEHDHGDGKAHRDNNMRAAVVHVIADAAVSVLVIVGLLLARAFSWLWMDPLAGIVGACVIASWTYGLVQDTGAILLGMNPGRAMSARLRHTIEQDGDRLTDLHLWCLGPGHYGAILSVTTIRDRTEAFYRAQLAGFKTLSHVTIEVEPAR